MRAGHRAKVRAAVALSVARCALAPAEGLTRALPREPLADALDAVARATGVQILHAAVLANGIVSPDANAAGGTDGSASGRSVFDRESRGRELGSSSQSSDLVSRRSPQQVIVTGGRIPGFEPVGAMVIELSRADIDRSGYTRVADLIRSLPQSFRGGPGGGTHGHGKEELYNASHAEGVNLRGLGAGSTLVLIEGRRIAPGAGGGRFMDVSAIPAAATSTRRSTSPARSRSAARPGPFRTGRTVARSLRRSSCRERSICTTPTPARTCSRATSVGAPSEY